MKRYIPHLAILGMMVFTMSGCAGYQLGAVKPSAYSGIRKIHVPPFKNSTLEPRLSSLVTNAVIKELQADGTYQIASRADADAVLVADISKVEKSQLRAVRTNTLQSSELQLFLYINFHLANPSTNTPITTMVDESLTGRGDKRSQSDTSVTKAHQGVVIGKTIQNVDTSFQVGERNAQSLAAEDAAQQLVSQLANGW